MNPTSTGLVGASTEELPVFEKPNVGDKIIVKINQFGNVYIFKEGQMVKVGDEYYELEVKAIRTAKVSFE